MTYDICKVVLKLNFLTFFLANFSNISFNYVKTFALQGSIKKTESIFCQVFEALNTRYGALHFAKFPCSVPKCLAVTAKKSFLRV